MYMQIVNSKKYKEKLLRIIMSNTAENPEFETFMNGLQTLKGQGEDKYIESLIMSINKTKKSFEKYDGDDEIPDGCVSFVLFEREQRNCAFYYVMLIALFASYGPLNKISNSNLFNFSLTSLICDSSSTCKSSSGSSKINSKATAKSSTSPSKV